MKSDLDKIDSFLAKHHLMSLATAGEDELSVCSLFYVFDKEKLSFVVASSDDTTHIQLDSVKIMNRSQGGESMIYWPDTSIYMQISPGDRLLYIGYATILPVVGIQDINVGVGQFQVFQNYCLIHYLALFQYLIV